MLGRVADLSRCHSNHSGPGYTCVTLTPQSGPFRCSVLAHPWVNNRGWCSPFKWHRYCQGTATPTRTVTLRFSNTCSVPGTEYAHTRFSSGSNSQSCLRRQLMGRLLSFASSKSFYAHYASDVSSGWAYPAHGNCNVTLQRYFGRCLVRLPRCGDVVRTPKS